MLDTVTLHLHNVKKHHQIVSYLRSINNGFKKSDVLYTGTLQHEVTEQGSSGEIKEKFLYKVQHAASSHYKIIFVVDHYGDVIIINFSIPKYFYGHNIAQAIKNPNESGFIINQDSYSLNFNEKEVYKRLMAYISKFFENEFTGMKYDANDVELKRIDFCFNQFFKDKKEALQYLDIQKEIKKKYLRENSTASTNYETSIFYSNPNYSVKIYHKGTEFQKNDSKELEKVSKSKGCFDVPYLQSLADRILRYEITFRPAYMSYIYNTKVFRKKSKQFLMFKDLHGKIKRALDKAEKQGVVMLPEKYQMIFNEFDHYQIHGKSVAVYLLSIYDREDRDKINSANVYQRIGKCFFKDFDKLLNWRRRFYFRMTNHDLGLYLSDNITNDNMFRTVKHIPVTSEWVTLCVRKLQEFMFDMKVDFKDDTRMYLDKIDRYNCEVDNFNQSVDKWNKSLDLPRQAELMKKKKSHLSKSKLGMIIHALESYNFTEIQKLFSISGRTMANYKSQLKLIDYSKNIVARTPIKTELNFHEYYKEVFYNLDKVFNTRIFKF